jgi:hypothetical protein
MPPAVAAKTLRRMNASTYRVPARFTPPDCPADMAWLAGVLAENGLRAYNGAIALNDPKQRRPVNELSNWCQGDGFQLWDRERSAYVPALETRRGRQAVRLESFPLAAR